MRESCDSNAHRYSKTAFVMGGLSPSGEWHHDKDILTCKNCGKEIERKHGTLPPMAKAYLGIFVAVLIVLILAK